MFFEHLKKLKILKINKYFVDCLMSILVILLKSYFKNIINNNIFNIR